MYSIITVTDGIERTIYDPLIGSFLVQSPKLTEELNQPGSLEFSLLYGHDAFGNLKALKTYVTVYKDDEEIFYGRVLSVEPNVLLGTEEIVCEGAMSFLNDGHLPPDPRNSGGGQTHQTQTAEEFFNRVIDAYNSDVDDYRRMFTVGEVSHSRKSETKEYQISNYMSAKEAIENDLVNQYGGFIRIRPDGEGGHLIDWIESYDRTNEGIVELGENIITQTNRMSGEDMFTAIRPVGKDGLIHSTIPVIDIYSEDDMLSYGRIIKNVDFPNITTEAALLAAGSTLADRINKTLYISSEINLLDLHVLDEEEPDVRVGDEFTNIAGLDNVSLIVSARTSDFENPQNDSISLKNAKHLEGNGLDDYRNDGSTLSKRSAGASGGVGMALKYYHELDEEVSLHTERIRITAVKLLELKADELIEQGNNLISLSNVSEELRTKVADIEGTGVYQNSEAITNVAGKFNVVFDAAASLYRVQLVEGAMLQVQEDGVYSDVIGQNGMSSSISQTAGQIRSEVANSKSDIYSAINQTASAIWFEVGRSARVYHQYSDPASTETVPEKSIWIKDSGVHTHANAGSFTHAELGELRLADFYGSDIYVRKNGEWVKVGGDQLSEMNYARLKIEQDRISIITDGMSGEYGEFIVELGRMQSSISDIETGLNSVIEQTAEMIRTAVWTANSEMYSEILQTQSMIRSTVSNAESRIQSSVEQTASGLHIEINRKRAVYLQPNDPSTSNTMYNGDLWVTDNGIYSHAAMATKTHATLGSYGLLDFLGKKTQVWKNTGWIPFFDERTQNLDQTLIDINERGLSVLRGNLNEQYAQFQLEKTRIRSIVNDKVNQLGSEIVQTANEIRTSVWSANSQIYSSISQTATQIRTEVTNRISSVQSSITQNADKIALVVSASGIKAGEIVTAINARTGTSVVRLSADQIDINGIVSALNGKLVTVQTIAAGTASLSEISLESGGTFYVRESGSYWGYGNSVVGPMGYTIIDAEVIGNTLHLYTLDGDDIPFSKATTLTPSWNGSTLTMAAKQTNDDTTTTVASKTIGFGGLVTSHDVELQIANNGSPTKVANLTSVISCPVKVEQLTTQDPVSRYTRDVQFNVSSLLQEKTITSNGTYTPDSGYIGLSSITVNVSGGGGTIDIPSTQIYTSSTSRGTKLTTLRTRYEQARADGDYVMFRVDCGGSSKWYYMEP